MNDNSGVTTFRYIPNIYNHLFSYYFYLFVKCFEGLFVILSCEREVIDSKQSVTYLRSDMKTVQVQWNNGKKKLKPNYGFVFIVRDYLALWMLFFLLYSGNT